MILVVSIEFTLVIFGDISHRSLCWNSWEFNHMEESIPLKKQNQFSILLLFPAFF